MHTCTHAANLSAKQYRTTTHLHHNDAVPDLLHKVEDADNVRVLADREVDGVLLVQQVHLGRKVGDGHAVCEKGPCAGA